MDPEMFLKAFLERWDRPLAWVGCKTLEELERLKGRHEVVTWIREYFAERSER